jgi:hypothetical protein
MFNNKRLLLFIFFIRFSSLFDDISDDSSSPIHALLAKVNTQQRRYPEIMHFYATYVLMMHFEIPALNTSSVANRSIVWPHN